MRTLLLAAAGWMLAGAVFAADDTPPGAAIASAHHLATDAGHEVLAKGGNAFDAAIAVSSTSPRTLIWRSRPLASAFARGDGSSTVSRPPCLR